MMGYWYAVVGKWRDWRVRVVVCWGCWCGRAEGESKLEVGSERGI